jgi:hypothetical protein
MTKLNKMIKGIIIKNNLRGTIKIPADNNRGVIPKLRNSLSLIQ